MIMNEHIEDFGQERWRIVFNRQPCRATLKLVSDRLPLFLGVRYGCRVYTIFRGEPFYGKASLGAVDPSEAVGRSIHYPALS